MTEQTIFSTVKHLSFTQRFDEHFNTFFKSFYKEQNILNQALCYALEAKGKRVRPTLSFLVHDLFSNYEQEFLEATTALEMVHSYSLIHDDLPILDNDDYRRNRLTVHKKFDEASALLAGNALLSDAFYILSSLSSKYDSSKLMRELSLAVGSFGMIKGQFLDVFWTAKKNPNTETLDTIHLLKTGKLLSASCAFGAICAKQNSETIENIKKFGNHLGLAYQIIDDLLDNSTCTGKSQGKDKTQDKLTYLKLYDYKTAHNIAKNHTEKAYSYIKGLSSTKKETQLVSFCEKLLKRKY